MCDFGNVVELRARAKERGGVECQSIGGEEGEGEGGARG